MLKFIIAFRLTSQNLLKQSIAGKYVYLHTFELILLAVSKTFMLDVGFRQNRENVYDR